MAHAREEKRGMNNSLVNSLSDGRMQTWTVFSLGEISMLFIAAQRRWSLACIYDQHSHSAPERCFLTLLKTRKNTENTYQTLTDTFYLGIVRHADHRTEQLQVRLLYVAG